MKIENIECINGIYVAKNVHRHKLFQSIYSAVKAKENRVYSNYELRKLPDTGIGHAYYKEWKVRKASCRKLVRYLKARKQPLRILEIGCGNGWFSHKLAEIPQTEVIAADINLPELQQAAAVFKKENLQFLYGDIRDSILQTDYFDAIVFAASIPYFPSATEIIKCALKYLAHGGEIHIVDSFFYGAEDIIHAKQRCISYYNHIGIPEMSDYFFHHPVSDLNIFNCREIPQQNLLGRIFFNKPVFPWFCIQREQVKL